MLAPSISFQPLESANPVHLSAGVSIWNAACGADLAITSHFVVYNLQPMIGVVQAGQIAVRESRPVGFVLASALPGDRATSPPEVGWIDAIAVLPNAQRQGIGGELLAWAENRLREQGCTAARLGGSLCPFVAGYPTELGNEDFFSRRGYEPRAGSEQVWDVARDPSDYGTTRRLPGVTIRPAGTGDENTLDENTLLEFFRREFPNRWRFEYEEFLRRGGRISDWIVLFSERGVDGFARLTLEDSIQPLERFYPQRLPRPWAQLGPIGVSAHLRGRGYGRALLDASLVHLRERGVRGCVIDWTDLIDFYARFGFKPYRKYAVLVKTV